MAKAAVDHTFTGTTVQRPTYDPTATVLGKHIVQEAGAVGPAPITMVRPMEQSTAISAGFPHVIAVDSNTHWVFLADVGSAAPTRRISLYEYKLAERTWSWRGFVNLTYPSATNHTIRGFRAFYDKYTTGTVAVTGTAVTGSGTSFQTDGLAVGARIGFGSTNPSAITTWYDISAVGSNTALTLATTAGTVAAGTAYVIEEIRIGTVTTNATAANGGLFVTKGLHRDVFTPSGTTIPAATTVDNIRAVYWLADAAVVTNTIADGLALEDRSGSTQHAYVLNGATNNVSVYKYNLRAPLTDLAAGKSTLGFVLNTGVVTVVGTASASNNGRVVAAGHGPGSGVQSLYFVTTTRVYRAALTQITQGSTTWTSDVMTEIPPGGASLFVAGATMNGIEYAGSVDRFLITGTNASGARSNYLTRYQTVGDPFDDSLFMDYRHYDQSLAGSVLPPFPDTHTSVISTWAEDGIAYICRNSTAVALNQVYALPLAADSHFSTGHLITPAMSTAGATRLYNVYVADQQISGPFSFGVQSEPYKVSVRTAGIADDSGSWTPLADDGDLSGITPGSQIQFKFEFRIVGTFCVPSKIYGIAVTFEEGDDIPFHLQWDLNDSATANGTVGIRQVASYGSTFNLQIEYRQVSDGSLVMTQASTGTANGVFEFWDGSAWVAGVGSDTVNTRRRFRPTVGLPAATELYATVRVI